MYHIKARIETYLFIIKCIQNKDMKKTCTTCLTAYSVI